MTTEYTEQQRRLIVDALQKAKPFLWDGKDPKTLGWDKRPRRMAGICPCVMAVTTKRSISRSTEQMVTKLIRERLHPFNWLGHWLLANKPEMDAVTPASLQAHRLAWMDKLIEEFSS